MITLKEIDEMVRICEISRHEVILCAFHDNFDEHFSHVVYTALLEILEIE